MADNVIASFMVALGFTAATSEQKKAEKSVNDFEKAVREAEARIVTARRDRAKTTEQLAQLELQQNLKNAQAALRAAKEQEKASAASVKAIKDAEAKKNKAQAESTAFSIAKINLFIEALKTMANAARHALSDTIAGFDQLYYAAGRTGSTVNNLRSLGHAFGQVGGSSTQALQTVESFTRALRNNPGLQGFVKGLGVSDKLDGVEKLLATVDKLNEQPHYVAVQQAGMLGISEESFDLLTRQSAGIKRYRQEYKEAAAAVGLNEEEASKASHRFSQSMGTLSMIMEVSFSKLLTDMLPRISGWLDTLANWIRSHQPEIGQFVRTVAGYIEQFGAFIEQVFKSLQESMNDGSFKENLKSFVTAIKEVAAAFGTMLKFIQAIGNTPVWQAIKFAATWPSSLLGGIIGGAHAGELGGGGAGGGYGTPGTVKDDRSWIQRNMPRGLGGKDAPSPTGGVPVGSSAGNLTALVEEEAKRAGIDPRIMHGIRAGESGHRANYDVKSDSKEDSYGPFQLNRRGGLGAIFEKETGLDLHDPKTIPAQARWVADHIRKKLAADPNYNPGKEWFGYRGLQNAQAAWGDSGYTPTQSAGDVPPNKDGAGGLTQQQGGATRSQPITDVLKRQITAAAAAAGVNAEVYSGGQDEDGPNSTGSHRHDHGNSADLKLYTIGPGGKKRYLDMTNDADRTIMERFVRESVKNGANGIGAGPGYMGGRTNMHVGGGAPGVWGAGGAGANAPDWLRKAHADGMADRNRQRSMPPALQGAGDPVADRNRQRSMPPALQGAGDPVAALTSPGPMGASSSVDNSQANRAISQNNNVKVEIHGSSDPARQANKMEAALSRVHQMSLENAQGAVGA